jgi:hypothetical protein
VALVKKIVLFIITLFFISILLIGATKGFAMPFHAGAGKGTLDCEGFVKTTSELDEEGKLHGRSYIYRLEYIQWAYGFLTAFNIRHYEQKNYFKDLNSIAGKDVTYEDMYEKLVRSCEQLDIKNNNDFGMAVYSIFARLPGHPI